MPPRYPALYQVNTRVWLTGLSPRSVDPPRSTTSRTPSWTAWRRRASTGSGCSRSGGRARPAARSRARIPTGAGNSRRRSPTCGTRTSRGSGFAIAGYAVDASLGGDAALARLRARLRARGLRLMLDFVPNHTALDHPWIEQHPEFYVAGSEIDLTREPHNYTRVKGAQGGLLLAHGRDPYFPGWPDTLQLDYANPAVQDAMIGELARICRAMRWRALRHGDARAAGRLRAHVGPPRAALLAASDRAGPRARSGVLLHGGGLLGPRVDAARTGVRLRVRQAALRSPARGRCAARARAPVRRARLPDPTRPLPRKPRRATRRGNLPARRAPGGGRDQLPVAGPALPPSGSARGPQASASRRTSVRAPQDAPDAGLLEFYRRPARRAAPARLP